MDFALSKTQADWQEAAIRFAREGADVVVSDVNAGSAQSTLAEVEAAGQRGLVVVADVREPASCRQLVDEAVPRPRWEQAVAERAAELASRSSRPAGAQGIALKVLAKQRDDDRIGDRLELTEAEVARAAVAFQERLAEVADEMTMAAADARRVAIHVAQKRAARI